MTACCGVDAAVFGHPNRDCPSTMVPPLQHRSMDHREMFRPPVLEPLAGERVLAPAALPEPFISAAAGDRARRQFLARLRS